MKTHTHWMVAPTILALMLGVTGAAHSKAPVIELTPGFNADPLAVSGKSGGQKATLDCGKIAAAPNHEIKMTQDFQYLRFSVQSAGQPTLLIEEPGGRRTCVLADGFSGGNIESPGYWKQGSYSIYIGDRAGASNPYTLSITQKVK